MNKLISVIVPVYNVEKYLSQCLENLIFQTYKNIEIIIVDDGSPDKSADIYNKYAAIDCRISIIKQENAGLSAARNKGMSLAKGDYIHFMDSDDYIDLNYYEKMLETAEQTQADMVCSGTCVLEDERFSITFNQRIIFTAVDDKINATKIYRAAGVWRFLYKRSFIEKMKLSFELGRLFEDVIFSTLAAYHSNKIALVPDVNYYYNYNPNSIMHDKDKSDKLYEDERYVRNIAKNFASLHGFEINKPLRFFKWSLLKYKLFSRLTLIRKKVYADKVKYFILGGKICVLTVSKTEGND
jgi:CDP-glycerol glycerophosphotransferase